MPAILASIIVALVNGQSIGVVLGALSSGQWAALIAGIGAELEPTIAKLFGLTPAYSSLGQLIDAVVKIAGDELAKEGLRAWLSDNADWAMRLQPGISAES